MANVTDNPFEGFENGTEVEVTIKGKLNRMVLPWPYAATEYLIGATFVPASIVQSVRRIEPEYEVGEIYVSKYMHAYYRLPDRQWRHCKTGEVQEDSMPTRPMRKLIAE